MSQLTPEDQKKQELYRDARSLGKYDNIWQTVGKCVFCELNEKYVFFEENGVVMTISLYAYIDGHFMIVPRRHIRSAKDLTQLEWETVRKFMYIAKRLFKEVHGVKGMQFVQKEGAVAQSTVEHIHFHCIPFNDPNLSTWNYKKLDHTPLENVDLYKKARKKLISTGLKFDKKYAQHTALPVICDVIIASDDGILFQERATDQQLQPAYITLPGGRYNPDDDSLEAALVREVREETSIELQPENIQLMSSQIDGVTRKVTAKPLKVIYAQPETFLRNTYLVKNPPLPKALIPGDDAKKLIWVPLQEVQSREDISPETKEIIAKAGL